MLSLSSVNALLAFALAGLSRTVLTRSGGRRHPRLTPELREREFLPSPLGMTQVPASCRFLHEFLSSARNFPSSPRPLRVSIGRACCLVQIVFSAPVKVIVWTFCFSLLTRRTRSISFQDVHRPGMAAVTATCSPRAVSATRYWNPISKKSVRFFVPIVRRSVQRYY